MALRTLLIAGAGVLATALIGTAVAIGGYSLARTQSRSSTPPTSWKTTTSGWR